MVHARVLKNAFPAWVLADWKPREVRSRTTATSGNFKWHVEEAQGEAALRASARGFSRPLQYTKEISVQDRSVCVRHNLENGGGTSTSFLYACHPLLAVETGDIVVLPDEVRTLALNYSRNSRLGNTGDVITWPRHMGHEVIDLSSVLPSSSAVAEMLYTGRLREGWCGLYRSSAHQGIVLRFDTARLPYLGIWLCYGGWPERGEEPLQYAVALEPTTAPYGTLLDAQKKNEAKELEPGEAFDWTIIFQISDRRVSLESFRHLCSTGSSLFENKEKAPWNRDEVS